MTEPSSQPRKDWSRVFTKRAVIFAAAVTAVVFLLILTLHSCISPVIPGPTTDAYAPVEKHVNDAFSEGNPHR